MSNDWDFYFLSVNDELASIFLDLGIVNDVPVKSHPTMAYLSLHMLNPHQDVAAPPD